MHPYVCVWERIVAWLSVCRWLDLFVYCSENRYGLAPVPLLQLTPQCWRMTSQRGSRVQQYSGCCGVGKVEKTIQQQQLLHVWACVRHWLSDLITLIVVSRSRPRGLMMYQTDVSVYITSRGQLLIGLPPLWIFLRTRWILNRKPISK